MDKGYLSVRMRIHMGGLQGHLGRGCGCGREVEELGNLRTEEPRSEAKEPRTKERNRDSLVCEYANGASSEDTARSSDRSPFASSNSCHILSESLSSVMQRVAWNPEQR